MSTTAPTKMPSVVSAATGVPISTLVPALGSTKKSKDPTWVPLAER
jgi:hypothetical protein